MSQRRGLLSSLVLVALCAPIAQAQPAGRAASVVSVRGPRAYLRLEQEGALEAGGGVVLRLEGRELRARLLASSSRFLLVELPAGEALQPDQRLTVSGTEAAAAPAPTAAAAPASGPTAVSVGRPQPTVQDWRRLPPLTPERVSFRGVTAGSDQAAAASPPDEPRLPDNELRGELAVGFDGAYMDKGDVDRTTPYGRLRLEVRRLFGSDRASFLFYGSVRHPIDGTEDWTGRREEQLEARLSAFVLRLDARPAGQVQSFSDRIELRIGRDAVPDVVEAGVVDGIQGGLRIGPVTPFGFLGFASSLNPRREDYDSVTWGLGARFAQAFEHSGALRLSLAYAEEAFRGKGERRYVEARGDLRAGSFGARGALVYDMWSALRDEAHSRLTTGELVTYLQATDGLRLEAGYRERRAVYAAELVQLDLEDALQVILEPNPTPPPPAARNVADLLPESARRNVWLGASLRFLEDWDVRARGELLMSRESRDMTGGEVGLGVNDLLARDRLGLSLAVRHRRRGDGIARHVTEPTVAVSYSLRGASIRWLFLVAYRFSTPSEAGDRRLALRASFDADIAGGFGVRGYAELDLLRDPRVTDDTLLLAGLAAFLRF